MKSKTESLLKCGGDTSGVMMKLMEASYFALQWNIRICNWEWSFGKEDNRGQISKKMKELADMAYTILKSSQAGFKYSEESAKLYHICSQFETKCDFGPDQILNISIDELTAAYKALNLGTGHWYLCPNGHIYAIGDCGRAMVTSSCPECREQIGGGSHQLLQTNRPLGDFQEFLAAHNL
jgi:hypothetical protein